MNRRVSSEFRTETKTQTLTHNHVACPGFNNMNANDAFSDKYDQTDKDLKRLPVNFI